MIKQLILIGNIKWGYNLSHFKESNYCEIVIRIIILKRLRFNYYFINKEWVCLILFTYNTYVHL